MKAYIVFLNSGGSINGVMDDSEAEKLKQAYINKTPGVQEFRDDEGVFLLEPCNVTALTLSEPCRDVCAGFTKMPNTSKALKATE